MSSREREDSDRWRQQSRNRTSSLGYHAASPLHTDVLAAATQTRPRLVPPTVHRSADGRAVHSPCRDLRPARAHQPATRRKIGRPIEQARPTRMDSWPRQRVDTKPQFIWIPPQGAVNLHAQRLAQRRRTRMKAVRVRDDEPIGRHNEFHRRPQTQALEVFWRHSEGSMRVVRIARCCRL